MRERYFRMYESIKYKECYYAAHGDRANTCYHVFTAITLVISIVSVLVWSISKSMPALWAIIISVAQFIQVFSVNLPWASQITALKYLLPELRKLSLRIDRDWLAIDINGYEDTKILDLISQYESAFADLENQFTSDVVFPERASVLEKAEKDQRAYFYSKYPYTENAERSEAENVK